MTRNGEIDKTQKEILHAMAKISQITELDQSEFLNLYVSIYDLLNRWKNDIKEIEEFRHSMCEMHEVDNDILKRLTE